MDKTARVFSNHAELKAEEYRFWQSRPVYERMDAVSEFSYAAYRMKEALPDVPRLQRAAAVLSRPRR
jgi:hypothetical protein